MTRNKLALLTAAAAAATALTTLCTPAAFGAAKFEWSVNGTPLAAGVKLTILFKHDPVNGTIVFKGTAFATATELLASAGTATANIQGGRPGTGEGIVTFESITVDKPKNCTVANIKTNNTKAKIVESTGGKPLILLSPVTGSTFAVFRYAGASCSLAGDEVNVIGSVLLEPLSTNLQELQLFTFLPSGLKSKNSAGEEATNTLEIEGGTTQPITITGNVEALLDAEQPFSPL